MATRNRIDTVGIGKMAMEGMAPHAHVPPFENVVFIKSAVEIKISAEGRIANLQAQCIELDKKRDALLEKHGLKLEELEKEFEATIANYGEKFPPAYSNTRSPAGKLAMKLTPEMEKQQDEIKLFQADVNQAAEYHNEANRLETISETLVRIASNIVSSSEESPDSRLRLNYIELVFLGF